MRVIIDPDRCDSTGLCAAIAPEVFEIDEQDELRIHTESLDQVDRQTLEQAARACPKLAITLGDGY
jgi:ferredoxin